MMRKVGNRRLLVTTSVPGHHRPIITKQLKCQSPQCGSLGRRLGESTRLRPRARNFRVRQRRAGGACGKAAFAADGAPNRRPIPRHRAADHPGAIKAAATRRQHSADGPDALRNLGAGSSVNQPTIASRNAKPKMPTNYTANDFVLIRLHRRRARTISVLVTTRERVGRSMIAQARSEASAASTQGEMTR